MPMSVHSCPLPSCTANENNHQYNTHQSAKKYVIFFFFLMIAKSLLRSRVEFINLYGKDRMCQEWNTDD